MSSYVANVAKGFEAYLRLSFDDNQVVMHNLCFSIGHNSFFLSNTDESVLSDSNRNLACVILFAATGFLTNVDCFDNDEKVESCI